MTHYEKVRDLERELLGSIKTMYDKKSLGEDDSIEFNNPFVIYVTEDDSYTDDFPVKVPFIVSGMLDGYNLGGTSGGSEYEMSIDQVESVFELGYIADLMETEQFKIHQF
jgi:hypothetical protein